MKRYFLSAAVGSLMMGTVAYAEAPLALIVNSCAPQFTVELKANASTGYSWKVVKYDETHFQFLRQDYVAPNTGLIGAVGTAALIFELKAGQTYPSDTEMSFVYGRSWEKQQPAATPVKIHFECKR
jgi:predicted secreted protein